MLSLSLFRCSRHAKQARTELKSIAKPLPVEHQESFYLSHRNGEHAVIRVWARAWAWGGLNFYDLHSCVRDAPGELNNSTEVKAAGGK